MFRYLLHFDVIKILRNCLFYNNYDITAFACLLETVVKTLCGP